MLIEKVDKLTAHSLIAIAQPQYLKQKKEELEEHEVIVWWDLAENLKFVIQDEVQSFHWNSKSCTLDLFVIYGGNNDELKSYSLSLSL